MYARVNMCLQIELKSLRGNCVHCLYFSWRHIWQYSSSQGHPCLSVFSSSESSNESDLHSVKLCLSRWPGETGVYTWVSSKLPSSQSISNGLWRGGYNMPMDIVCVLGGGVSHVHALGNSPLLESRCLAPCPHPFCVCLSVSVWIISPWYTHSHGHGAAYDHQRSIRHESILYTFTCDLPNYEQKLNLITVAF